MAYLLDANVLITAKNFHYGFDFCPGFWDWLIEQNAHGKVLSVEKVGDELKAGNDELATWAKEHETDFFVSPDPSVATAFATVSAWAGSGHYQPAAASTFLQKADYFLVAQALAGGHVVVTHEVPAGSQRIIKIPDACIAMGVKCVPPWTMLRLEHARFVLGSPE